jgi:hypothetical protein
MALTLPLAAEPADALSFTTIASDFSGNTGYDRPALDAGILVFRSLNFTTGVDGIYKISDGVQTTVADTTMTVPGRSVTFREFHPPSISDGNVAFIGEGGDFGGPNTYGMYASFGGGPVTEIVGLPGPAGTPEPAYYVDAPDLIDGTRVAFHGRATPSTRAIYVSDNGVLEKLVDEATTPGLPGVSGQRILLDEVSIDETGVAFSVNAFGTSSSQSLFVASDGGLRLVADTNTSAPGGGGNFAGSFGPLASDDGNLAFAAYVAGTPWIYAEIGGVLTPIIQLAADSYVDRISIHGENVAWYEARVGCAPGTNDCPQTLYAYWNGQIVKVAESGDVLDGHVIRYFLFGADALSGDQLAFTAAFTDNTGAVYLANIPEPGTALLLAAGLLALGASRRCSAR